MKDLLRSYVNAFDCSNLSLARHPQTTRRACALALARDLLIKNKILSAESTKQTTIQHYASGMPYLKIPTENNAQPRTRPLALQISNSHSGAWIACLISEAEYPAGIDLEDLSIKRSYLKLAEHYFSVSEIEYVKRHGPEAFYKLWTAKEAIAKLQGKGLAEALKIQLDPVSLDSIMVCTESCHYRLERQITQDYIYTIARKYPATEQPK